MRIECQLSTYPLLGETKLLLRRPTLVLRAGASDGSFKMVGKLAKKYEKSLVKFLNIFEIMNSL